MMWTYFDFAADTCDTAFRSNRYVRHDGQWPSVFRDKKWTFDPTSVRKERSIGVKKVWGLKIVELIVLTIPRQGQLNCFEKFTPSAWPPLLYCNVGLYNDSSCRDFRWWAIDRGLTPAVWLIGLKCMINCVMLLPLDQAMVSQRTDIPTELPRRPDQ